MLKKIRILTQKYTPQKFTIGTHKQRIRWLLAVSTIPFLGILTAFGIAPYTLPENVPVTAISQEIAMPQASDLLSANTDTVTSLWRLEQTQRGDTLSSVLSRLNIRNSEAVAYLRQAPEASALATQLAPGRTLLAETTEQGDLLELQFQLDSSNALVIKKTSAPAGYSAETKPMTLEKRVIVKSAEIRSSLFGATDDADIPDAIATKIADIFSSDIDFNQDLRRGDHLTVIYEAAFNNGELVKTGKVLAAEFVNKGRTIRGIAYGDEGYYTPDGKSLHKSFLRSPLEFTRISSGFSLARWHPILNTMRAHKGVDYAAPIGTKVKAVADATVSFVGQHGGYGNMIILDHHNGITTVYGHLSRFAPETIRGHVVHQGDVIGFVGMTGLATGPHLHYEYRINGVFHDPVTVALPAAVPLAESERAGFSVHAKPLLSQLDLLHDTDLAALE
ncbi:MAG TPA: M23 family metallopeptidase [Methylophilaceae bacterium]